MQIVFLVFIGLCIYSLIFELQIYKKNEEMFSTIGIIVGFVLFLICFLCFFVCFWKKVLHLQSENNKRE
ncbi:MAG TPA: hypothetical protein DDZ96_10470 [Porphyromonadaceae bacterium]|nr:hypothetical protein [Porphyromonadaceae bacterium]HBL34222.1 hypothetical protein [Porphyromonadaceae bacterium]HBX19033.1 hypothetical protein [Porphyromonadaceae bacterium]HCM21887.1 hypothetical protein [Porphyromonadaceae bacterium]